MYNNKIMNFRFSILFIIFLAIGIFLSPPSLFVQGDLWRRVDDGLFLGEFVAHDITIIRIDPGYYSFKLLCASERGNIRMPVRKWCQRYNLISAINAGMYQKDGIKNVGYMRNFSHINNPRLNTRYKALLAFNPIDESLPEVQIIDMKCQDFEKLKDRYNTVIQGIRMTSCRQENVWQRQEKKWSISAFGIDRKGNGLFIFAESPISVHDLTNILLSLPISLYNAMYLEGGPEASLYFSANGIEFEKIGSHETISKEENFSKVARSIPNVIGIVKREK